MIKLIVAICAVVFISACAGSFVGSHITVKAIEAKFEQQYSAIIIQRKDAEYLGGQETGG